jgi:hypothetical protein
MALNPQSEDHHTYPLDADVLVLLQPSCSVPIPGREQSFLNCGKFIILNEPLTIDSDVDVDTVTLHARLAEFFALHQLGISHVFS